MRTTTKAVWTLCALFLGQSSTRSPVQAAPMPDAMPQNRAARKLAAGAAQSVAGNEKESRTRLYRLAQAALQASHQTDDKFRFSNGNYAAKVQAFLPGGTSLSAKSGVRPRFNDNLANISVHAIEDPQNVVLFYEGRNQNLDFRYNGWAVVAFADGSVRGVTSAQAQNLRWHWSRVLDAQENDAKNGVDLSSPEATARLFIGALNAGRFDLARRCISGVDAARATNEALPGWDPSRFALDLSQFEPQQLAFTVSVAQYQVKVGATPFFDGGMTAFIFDKGWRIAPAPGIPSVSSPLQTIATSSDAPSGSGANRSTVRSASRPAGTLSLLAAALLNPRAVPLDAVLGSTTNSLQSVSAQRLKQLGLGVMQFTQDYDENINFGPNDFQQKLNPYVKNADVFRSPLTGRPYVMNPALSGLNLAQIDAPAQTVLFYEGSNGQLFFSSEGTAAILFMDGHVGYVTPEQAANLIWMPPLMPMPAPEAAPPDADEASQPAPVPAPELGWPYSNEAIPQMPAPPPDLGWLYPNETF